MSVNVAGGRVCTSVRTAAPIEFSLVLDEFEPGSPVVQYLMSGASACVERRAFPARDNVLC